MQLQKVEAVFEWLYEIINHFQKTDLNRGLHFECLSFTYFIKKMKFSFVEMFPNHYKCVLSLHLIVFNTK